ncbi:FG-GAP repeat protein [Natrinema salsiterrestre]|uniref:FG-GAP repeat protein n=1 Tax=Natrinema salsiterrestre TaxID=2950540 RepID=A0A9Q4L0F3_9EURY|nr:FG-GAP repeat protein [Natrinema salsiterrestre]MDF9744523.1 FG-GAP repeat protein [Natrinema salsiterrestre]
MGYDDISERIDSSLNTGRRPFLSGIMTALFVNGGLSVITDKVGATSQAGNENWPQQVKLIADDGESGDAFGNSVALDGNTILIGAPGHGSAYIFSYANGSWTQQAELTTGDINGDFFGYSVALDGDTALIGASRDGEPNGRRAGSAYIFTHSGGDWNQQAKLVPNDGDSRDWFGQRVALENDTAVIGAPHDEDPNGDLSGSAYIFTRSNGNWSQQTKLTPNDGDQDDIFGSSVAIDGNTVLIGAQGNENPNGDSAGSAYVFIRSNGDWIQEEKLVADDGDSIDLFGYSVALDSETALIGAEGDEDPNGVRAGSAYVFTRSSGNWSQQAKLSADDGDADDSFGWAVALEGDIGLIGARDDDDPNGESAGSAYIFTRSDGQWSQETKLAANDGDSIDQFGASVATNGRTAIIGATGDEDPLGYYAGSAYVFGQNRIQIEIEIKPDSDQNIINKNSKGLLPVAVLQTDDFDPTKYLDESSVRFGNAENVSVSNSEGASPAHKNGHIEDVNNDGRNDFLFHFPIEKIDVGEGTFKGKLVAKRTDGTPLVGTETAEVLSE